ncbi:hypothetical protein GCM10010123_29290 [Pilimelia anulata]|uniref:DUF3180 domain-containing protein n=1 Tax=Pilimelia anulata TaxID=53371 RepID=A0A8J3BCQ2_9ACTN|nr:DUF3180 domain-containing protein [Pilimelia anulata]GGJ97409.1 hypothetical protein GCM10010123_29290 [Pilimelia anulata]
MSAPDQPPDPPPPRGPGLVPTSPSTLVLAGLLTLALSWLLISRFYGQLPALPWVPAACSAVLAVVAFVLAAQTRARVAGRRVAAPLLVARLAVLAKASSVTGAVFAGMYGGSLVWLMIEQARAGSTEARTADVPVAVAGTVAALALVTGGLLLERACRVPPRDDDPEPPPAPPA